MFWWTVALLLLLGILLWGVRFSYRLAFYSRNDREQDIYAIPPGKQYEDVADVMLKNIHELSKLPFEQVFITSRDGIKLAARYYHIKDKAPVQIQFHGYRGNGLREYSGGYKMAARLGYNSLVVDERAHGKSGGHTISFGIKERYDCLDWVNYVCERFGKETTIILSGVSMGAATVLMASELNLPSNVIAITADCPYSSPGAIIRKVCEDIKLPGKLLYPFVVLGALVFGKFRIWESSAVEAVKHMNIPILLIHGDDDRFVPCQMSKEIYEACASDKKLALFPGAGHGLSYLTDTARYEQVFEEFLRNCGV